MRSKSRSRRRRMVYKRRALVLCVLVMLFVGFSSVNAFANSSNDQAQAKKTEKTYISYEIKSGDNLYAVAKEYCDLSHYKSYEEYITEIEKINHINSNKIVAGRYITIPQYV